MKSKMKNMINLTASYLLGLIYLIFGLNFFLNFIPVPPSDPKSLASSFMSAMQLSGFLTIIKILEIVGAILIFLPKTKRLGLLIITPISINVILYSTIIAGASLFQPIVLLILILNGYLIYSDKKDLIKFLNTD